MYGWSLPLGKVFGVELRLHGFFLLLLMLALVWSTSANVSAARGLALWLLLLLAVLVREAARGLVSAWLHLAPRRLLLLPTGGIAGYGSAEATLRASTRTAERALAIAGPSANLLFGLMCVALALSVAPTVDFTSFSLITPAHLLRALVWVNLGLAAVNLLPAWPLDAGRILHGEMQRRRTANAQPQTAAASTLPDHVKQLRALAGTGLAIAGGLIIAGIVTTNAWLVMAGFAVFLGARLEQQGAMVEAGKDHVRVADVMLEEYSILSASATLEDAVAQARHTLQDVFPVVRGGNMVGAVARQTVLEALESTGNGYIQGVMTREFQTATPEESLVTALSRVTAAVGVSSQLVVVLAAGEDDRVLGIITPQNLQRSMGLLTRRAAAAPAEDAG